ncbi:allene oxide cyclase barrel-like domain-containing protein [Streptomyces sp. CMB-StM0423]|uniref:allene oxide cyclase barrel-like domain-containing protein n=1 Tax=Streptomyces sp. CMB-StM0423 TaxID=2059884 RepID=UPI000C70D36D|nr:hypothetical protein [Streptomyces sp. CMB-StM0423]AUH44537.1 hypothetical protein CXR04_34000 [Streptomyces sp. CMB-StM0423]
MRPTEISSRLTAAGAAAIVLTVPIGASQAHAADTHKAECMTISFIEQLVTTETKDAAPVGPSVGDVVITEDAVLDDQRNRIGTNDIKGIIIKKDAETGELFSFSASEYTLDDGTIHVAGLVNLTQLAAGKEQKLPAYGTGGRYAGKVGELTWTLVSETESLNSIALCD